ncbi:Gpi16 subunit, GPI transamidase component [Dissoconium aciculare CBS 342.82]|uniref:Gpi16 subunit, GPI transamidase component n=1 Tax=Dissoconium aciculare CBS 342.82 TaxID=1314786 RepID=A0A6J3M7U1_9PEZI|nr:Gpi16 subunit, GPI transamidase component [Dissoconium aciculare CBS 342.82]KAF1823634.1 Gpi16 subunit, GPI transamidase component [Dissoconium aciculare CBS 342.82]
MRASLLVTPPALLACLALASDLGAPTIPTPEYEERLHLKPLSARAVYAGFNFTASTTATDYERQNFRFFPRSLGQILQYTHATELHLRFALGRWDEENWGSRPRKGAREGGTGVELWAWLEAGTQSEAEERWSSLVNSLSGLFCASLNFIEQTKTIQPVLTFEPEGRSNTTSSRLHLMHGMLPHEVVCTENLTPFLKLLPCKGKAGIASLLDGHKVFDANWQTMAVDVRSVCTDNHCVWEIAQTVDMVLDLERSMRPRDDPIPRPLPIENIACDQDKHYNAEDTCFPKSISEISTAWSLGRIFGRPIKGSCPIGDRPSAVDVVLEVSAEQPVNVRDGMSDAWNTSTSDGPRRQYRLQEGHDFDLELSNTAVSSPDTGSSLLRASRQMTGYGQERGGMHTVITNLHDKAQRVVYLESLPWFLRPYMHTLKVDGATIEKMFYTPAADRRKGSHIELLLEVPPHAEVALSYDFDKAILRYTEYPPDANRGFDVAAAIIRALPADNTTDEQGSFLRTTSLLLPLPTPDFSMPYNLKGNSGTASIDTDKNTARRPGGTGTAAEAAAKEPVRDVTRRNGTLKVVGGSSKEPQ